MIFLRASLLLFAAPLVACIATESGGIPYEGERFASVRLDFNT
ncbi:MAG: hypothetical protein ABGY71_02995 [bacterium]|jgi:hypothetical protein